MLELTDPLATALVTLLEAGLNATIDTLNAAVSDGFTIDHVAQVLDYVPTPSTLEGGLPAVGYQDLGGQFADDLQYSMDAEHRFAAVAIVQNADQRSLAWQLRRTLTAVARTIQADRTVGTPAGTGSIMKTKGGAWAVNFLSYEPGPLLDATPLAAGEAPPSAFMSYLSLVMSARRTEV